MQCENLKIPLHIYTVKVKYQYLKLQIIDFKLLNNKHKTKYKTEEFTPDLIYNNLNSNDFKYFEKNFLKLIKQPFFEISYSFKSKEGKYIYFKDYLQLIKKEKNIYTFFAIGYENTKTVELNYIFNYLKNSSYIGLAIYQDTFKEANKKFLKILKINKKTLLSLKPYEIFPCEYQEKIKEIVNRRLKGEPFSLKHSYEMPNFKEERIFIEFISQTILFNNKPAGLVIGIDKTKEYRINKYINISKKINSILVKEKDETSLLKKILKIFYKSNIFSLISLSAPTDIKNVENFTKDIKDIKIINEKISDKIKSLAILKIKDNFIFLGSSYKNDFKREVISILKELRKDLEYAIDNIYKNHILNIFYQAIEKNYQALILTDEFGNIIYKNSSAENINEKLLRYINFKKLSSIKDLTIDYNNNFYRIKILPVKIKKNKYFIFEILDITEQKKLKEKIKFDELTALLNRNSFFNESKEFKKNKYALILFDIKDFNIINKLKGTKTGNEILQIFSSLLKEIFHNSIIGRIGGDEFAILSSYSTKSNLLEKINSVIQNFNYDLNIGISVFKDISKLQEEFEKANIALFESKKEGTNKVIFFKETIHNELKHYFEAKEIIKSALQNNSFTFLFQPIIDAKTKKIFSAEALIRVTDKNNKLIPPYKFIDFLENSEYILDAEKLAFKKLSKNLPPIPISINLSAKSLKEKKHIKKIINYFKNKKVIFEITERALINLEQSLDILSFLNRQNIEIAIDDFGTGYSSFYNFAHMPLNELKIDKKFVDSLDKEKSKIILQKIIELCHSLNIKVVAEGVESKEQYELLKSMNVDYIQGYYFYKPMTKEELEEVLKNN